MKKKILFLIGSLDSGGVSKSMVSLLNTIDRNKYDVTLWMGNPAGLYYDLLPRDINMLWDKRCKYLLGGLRGLWPLLYNGNILLFIGSLARLILSLFNKAYAAWLLSRLMPSLQNDLVYDLIVDYNGQHQLYYMVDKLKGRKKISFFHSDYSKWPFYYSVDKVYYPKVDAIYTISPICVSSLKKFFPAQASKVFLMENINSPSLIRNMAQEMISDFNAPFKILTLGHISRNKGSDLAIKAAALLKQKGVRFKWYFLGKELEDFTLLIRQEGVSDVIEFLGMRANPYPYLYNADLYVHPSLFEGKSIALDEAKILCKPIVVTDFSTVHDQFEDRVNASICSMDSFSIANNIEELVNNQTLRYSYISYLRTHQIDNTSEIEKIYQLIS